MRIASVLGFLLALVAAGMVSITVSDLQNDIVAEATGPVAVLADKLTFLWLLVIMVMLVALVGGVIAWSKR